MIEPGVQFHPEATAGSVQAWASRYDDASTGVTDDTTTSCFLDCPPSLGHLEAVVVRRGGRGGKRVAEVRRSH